MFIAKLLRLSRNITELSCKAIIFVFLKVDGHCHGIMMPLTKTAELTRMLCVLKKLALEVIVQALLLGV
jgi:hypothetical protein